MSTRKLIAAALVCGLAILLAGGVQLVLLSRSDKPARPLAIGAHAQVGGLDAALVGSDRRGSVVVLTVEMALASDAPGPVGQPGVDWGLISRTSERVPSATPPGADACTGRDVAPGARLHCTVAFDAGTGALTGYTVVYRHGGQSALWSLA